REEQLRTMQEETELQRQQLQEELAGYKEQNKQHSLTIVAFKARLLEATQQQKALEEENAALVAKLEGSKLASPSARWSIVFLRRFREELAVMQSRLLAKETIIAGLTKELTETRARMSDLRGELSEKQKVELEQNLSQLKRQKQELNLLREQLSQMSSLMEEKDKALKAAAEELRYMPLCPDHKPTGLFSQQLVLDLVDLGAKCRGLRHEETIQRQKEGLAELRERVKVLEKRQLSATTMKGSEPLVILPKDLPEKIVQKMGIKKEPVPISMGSVGLSLSVQVPGCVPYGASHGAVTSKGADVTDLGEKMYLQVIGALGRLLEVEELSGMQPLEHLPREEREKVGLQRWKALELLCDKIRNLKSRLERKEEMLRDYEASVEQLRLNEASLRRCQEEMSKLEDEAFREAEEKALLREALERTQLQLNQEKRLLRAAKLHKV
ncbi:FHAD1 protein, partial [Brachypteracias leptosomus]|nr:FHAD1 protein [Brachypteracias leptosomus]